MSIADQIEKIGRALTTRELSKYLSVSTVTIFKLAAAGESLTPLGCAMGGYNG